MQKWQVIINNQYDYTVNAENAGTACIYGSTSFRMEHPNVYQFAGIYEIAAHRQKIMVTVAADDLKLILSDYDGKEIDAVQRIQDTIYVAES